MTSPDDSTMNASPCPQCYPNGHPYCAGGALPDAVPEHVLQAVGDEETMPGDEISIRWLDESDPAHFFRATAPWVLEDGLKVKDLDWHLCSITRYPLEKWGHWDW